MKWIIDYWYLIIAGLSAVLFFFGYKTEGELEQTNNAQSEEHGGEKSHGSDHSCCH